MDTAMKLGTKAAKGLPKAGKPAQAKPGTKAEGKSLSIRADLCQLISSPNQPQLF